MGEGQEVGSRYLLLGFKCYPSIRELGEGDKGMNSVREAQEKSSGRKYNPLVGGEGTVTPIRTSFKE